MKRHHCKTGEPRGYQLSGVRPVGQSFDVTGFRKPVVVAEVCPAKQARKAFVSCARALGARIKRLDDIRWEVIASAHDMQELMAHRSVTDWTYALSATVPMGRPMGQGAKLVRRIPPMPNAVTKDGGKRLADMPNPLPIADNRRVSEYVNEELPPAAERLPISPIPCPIIEAVAVDFKVQGWGEK